MARLRRRKMKARRRSSHRRRRPRFTSYRLLTKRQRRWVSRKIRLLRHEGYRQRQAIAIALSMAHMRRRLRR